MATTEPEVEDERGMGWPHHDGQRGEHAAEHDPCGRPPILVLLDPRLGDEQDVAALAAKIRDAREKRQEATS